MFKLMTFLILVVFCFGVVNADEPEKELQSLKKRRAEIFDKMVEIRSELIQKDPELKKIHDKIMSLHRELSIQLDKTKEIAPLAKEAKEIDVKIKKIEAEILKKEKSQEKTSTQNEEQK